MFARAAESSEDILAILEDATLYPIDCEKVEGIEKVNITVEGYVQKDALNEILKEP